MTLSGLILDALFPDACLSCLAPRDTTFRHNVACDPCLRSVSLPSHLTCATCNTPTLRIKPPCHPASASRTALAPRDSRITGELSSALLYDGLQSAAGPLSELLAAALISVSIPLHRAYVAPIPIFPSELRERGYDANLLLAFEIEKVLDITLAPQLLTAQRRGDVAAYGIGTPGDCASAHLVILIAVSPLSKTIMTHCTQLIRGACPHANVVFLTCIA